MSLRPLTLTLSAILAASPLAAQPDLESSETPAIDTAALFAPLPDWPAPNPYRLGSGAPGPEYFQQQADYVIKAQLDPDEETLRASAEITYTNNSPQPLETLWLHLEQNMFRSDSLGSTLSPEGARFSNRSDFEGGLAITSVTDKRGEPLPLQIYDTLGRIDLDHPIPAGGGQFEINIQWSFRIPEYGADRMGFEKVEQGTIFLLAQWFPAVAKYDDVHGWNTLPYVGNGEFYTDFGDYEVEITVPASFLVSATGALTNPRDVLTDTQHDRYRKAQRSRETVLIVAPEEVGTAESRPRGRETLTWKFEAEQVRTFAFAASDAFIWDAATTGETFVHSFYPKEALPLWASSTDMLAFAIEGYNKRWFEFPYPSAANINGPVGGMEYPMIIFCAERRNERGLYDVTTHEIGHNWFPMIVNTDERRYAWMDEGFDTFINGYSMLERFIPEGETDRLILPADAELEDGQSRLYLNMRRLERSLARSRELPIMTWPDRMPGRRLGYLAYGKPADGLTLLREQILGPERFDPAFRAYIERWAWKSPQPADFFRTIEDVAGADLAWFWRGWFYTTGTPDQAIAGVEFNSEERTCTVTIETLGELLLPIDLRVTYSDGSVADRRLPVECWIAGPVFEHVINLPEGVEVERVELNPRQLLPDIDRDNNLWSAAGAPAEDPAPEVEAEAAAGH